MFDARWGVLGAADVGAPHQRDRIWIKAKQRNFLSHAEHNRIGWREQQPESVKETNVAHTNGFDDALRGNGENYAESVARWRNELRGSIRDSGERCEEISGESKGLANTENQGDVRWNGQLGIIEKEHNNRRSAANGGGQWWKAEPNVGRVVDGLAARVDRLKAIGNGQVPLVAATAWETLSD